MILLPLQWDNHRGPDAVGQHKLTFTLDESAVSNDFNPMKVKKGTQFVVLLIEAGTMEQEEFSSETPEKTLERFRKWMNSLIGEVAKIKKLTPEVYREQFKANLKASGIIKESTKELNVEGLAKVINILKEIQNGSKS
jgi:hypothetical protein